MGAPDGMVAAVRPSRTNVVMDPRSHDRDTLRTIIAQWNANRLDLFELSEPDDNMQFYGVMRFYFQDDSQKIATKCIRVCSAQTVREIVEILIEKFRPDMRMLSVPRFSIYEVHANGEERRLRDDEKPLLVQLNWHKDDREGRFLLKNDDGAEKTKNGEHSKKSARIMSKQEKKELKKKEKEEKLKKANEALGIVYDSKENDAERLFKQLPETSFHRSISNPEAVMRRRRQQKLEKKLQQFKSKDGGPDTGGTLKIFGESINPDVPYKTLLLSINDTAEMVIKQTLEKYGLERDDYSDYRLVQAVLPVGSDAGTVDPSLIKEKILSPSDCPLQILMRFPAQEGILIFNLKKRSDLIANDHKTENGITRPLLSHNPYLVEVLPNGLGQAVQLFPGITEVGNDHLRLGAANFFHLSSPDVLPIHCVFNRLEATVTVCPAVPSAFLTIDGRKIENRAIVENGVAIRIGQCHVFRFFSPQSFNETAKPVPSLNRDKLQLPLASVALPKRSPDGDLRKHVALQMDTSEHDMMDTGSSVHSHRSSPDVHVFGRHNGLSSKLPILPATIEFREDHEDIFLAGVILHSNPMQITFKLSPAYVLYIAARYRASTNFRPEIVPTERAHLLTKFLHKMATVFVRVVEEHAMDGEYLAFWLANASELLHLLKLDRHMSPYGADAHDILADCLHMAFHHLTLQQQEQLAGVLPGLFKLVSSDSGWGDVLNVLSVTMSLLRRCRLNAALTIQLFSRLFHFVNVWLFNALIRHPEHCNGHFGNWLRAGLDHVLQWAEKQGLELAADCHLSKIIQVTNLLDLPKDESFFANFASACYRLNSIQVRFIMEHYMPAPQEYVTRDLVDNVVSIAKNLVDEPAQLNGSTVQLEEDMALSAQFLIPEDGYSVDVVCGVPTGLHEFLEPLCRSKICEMSVHPFSQGLWTVYLTPSSGNHSPSTSYDGRVMHPTQHLPNVMEISFQKGSSGIGLSIVAARGSGQEKQGIYIKSVVRGGAADHDGRLYSGDQLLKVNGKSLIGVSQDRAAELIAQSGQTVHLEVLKQGAFAHGLATMLNSPSPPPTAVKPPIANGIDRNTLSLTRESNPYLRNGSGYVSQNFTEFMPPEVNKLRVTKPPTDVKSPNQAPANRFQFQTDGYQPPQGSVTVRSPSPVRELIAAQMHSQRDKIRQEAKMLEMEDELRRRREQIHQNSIRERSPVPVTRPPPAVVARPLGGSQRSVSMERMDKTGRPPGEKRVQWAVDSPNQSPSPTIQLHPVNVQQVRPTEQPVRIAVPPHPGNSTARVPIAQEIQSWSRGFKERGENGGSPTSSPWNREETQRIKEERIAEARRVRDNEIAALQNRGDLSEHEEERLRTLLLERDFQRRAEEVLHREDEEEEAEDDDEQTPNLRQVPVNVVPVPKTSVPKSAPHLHHPAAAAAPEVYRTKQQEDYDQFLRRQEAHAINEAMRRSRDHLNNGSNGVQYVRVQETTYPLPAVATGRETSPNFTNGSKHVAEMNGSHCTDVPVTVVKRQTTGMEIRQEVEAARPTAVAVVGIHEVYNDPRNRILNAKTRLPVVDETSPEKLSFKDKMRMFASTVGEDPKDRIMASSKQRDLEVAFVTP